MFEKVYAAVNARFDEATGIKRRLVDWALPIGREVSRLQSEGKPIPGGLARRHKIADKLVFSKVRERLGGRLRLPISGGAPLAKDIAEFFDAIGIRILEGYGLTECTTASNFNRPEKYRFGTVGPPLPGFEVKTADDGEVLIRSETIFKGYFKDPEATAEVLLPDGWLKTGDIGAIDEDGFLTITDRKKDILVTAGGKNVAPQNIENDLKMSKYVSQALVVGDRRPYVAALITLDEPEIGRWASEQRDRRRPRGAVEQRSGARARAGHRRRDEPGAIALRADQAVRDHAARLHDGARRGDADAQAPAPRGDASTSPRR